MAPQASKKCGLLPPDHQQIGCCASNGYQFGAGSWQHFHVKFFECPVDSMP